MGLIIGRTKRGNMANKLCECCKLEVVEIGASEICPLCGWEDDEYQNDYPNYAGGANDLSLNEYRKHWLAFHKKYPDTSFSRGDIKL